MAAPGVPVEIELTYLAKELPGEIAAAEPIEMVDIYVPDTSEHPHLRIRRRGKSYEITKKLPVSGTDSSYQTEETIPLDADEYAALCYSHGKRVEKKRYQVIIDGKTAEVDVFTGRLAGLVLIDFEFETLTQKSEFTSPSCCLAEVTQEKFIAGGVLAGKDYGDISEALAKFGYKPLKL